RCASCDARDLRSFPTRRSSDLVVSGGVGGINESDVNLALTSNAVLVGFNVRADATARKLCQEEGLELRYYSVIYDIIDDVKKAMSGLLEPELREEIRSEEHTSELQSRENVVCRP